MLNRRVTVCEDHVSQVFDSLVTRVGFLTSWLRPFDVNISLIAVWVFFFSNNSHVTQKKCFHVGVFLLLLPFHSKVFWKIQRGIRWYVYTSNEEIFTFQYINFNPNGLYVVCFQIFSPFPCNIVRDIHCDTATFTFSSFSVDELEAAHYI